MTGTPYEIWEYNTTTDNNATGNARHRVIYISFTILLLTGLKLILISTFWSSKTTQRKTKFAQISINIRFVSKY